MRFQSLSSTIYAETNKCSLDKTQKHVYFVLQSPSLPPLLPSMYTHSVSGDPPEGTAEGQGDGL